MLLMKKRNLALAIGGAAGAAIAIKFLTRADTVSWEKVSHRVPHSDKSHFVSVDGARVHYQEFGDAANPTIVLLHGYTASVYVWRMAAPLLAEAGLHVIAFDLLGFGYSEKPRWFDYSIESHARIISRSMDRLGIGRATIVGSSYGGAVALALTLDNQERVDKLVLSDAVCNDQPKNHPLLKLGNIRGIGELITPFVVDSKFFLRKRMRGTIAEVNRHLITDERVESIRRPLVAADAHHSVLATSRNWHADRLEQDAHLIRRPTLIIWGKSDRVIPIECGRTLHREIPDSKFVIIRNCGHVPQEEKSEVFAGLVSEFAHPHS